MITNSPVKPRPAGREFAPMIPGDVLAACLDYPPALALWTYAQGRPTSWQFDDRGAIARALGWSLYRVRKAIRTLIDAGLYVVTRERNAAGQFVTYCQFAAVAVTGRIVGRKASPQVTPKVDSGSARVPSRKQLLRKSSRDRQTKPPARPEPPALWSPGPASERVAVAMGTTGLECEHGALPGRCGICRRRR